MPPFSEEAIWITDTVAIRYTRLKMIAVWITKYRYEVLQGEVAERVREMVRETCEAFEIRIVQGVVSKDHVTYL